MVGYCLRVASALGGVLTCNFVCLDHLEVPTQMSPLQYIFALQLIDAHVPISCVESSGRRATDFVHSGNCAMSRRRV